MAQATIGQWEHAVQTTRHWVAEVAGQFGTEDLAFAYRVTRVWLHLVRDRLPVVEAAHLGAQLPDLLRGVYYEGWSPSAVPVKYNRAEFIERFATRARVAQHDVPTAAGAVATALDRHLSGHLTTVLHHFPQELRELLTPALGDNSAPDRG